MHHFQEKCDDIKGTIGNRKVDDGQCNGQKKMDKRIEGQTIQWPKGNGQKDRRTDNTMAKKLKDKWTNGQTMIYKTLHKKTTD